MQFSICSYTHRVCAMNKYKVLINGRNFLVQLEEKPRKYGFYSNCFVEAESKRVAEYIAVRLVRDAEKLDDLACNRIDEPPVIYAEDITEIDSFESCRSDSQRLLWYREREEAGASLAV